MARQNRADNPVGREIMETFMVGEGVFSARGQAEEDVESRSARNIFHMDRRQQIVVCAVQINPAGLGRKAAGRKGFLVPKSRLAYHLRPA
jgi:hypothetical protein